ncbi:malignant T-cell-amplified sequence 1-like [Saccoglossus kowalevskii]|uniref:Malignant T-cell-amplified sequence 1-like n=1 Tax=Saccoglossus kowalevskii TaxID=10224 RepID=A0ABM0GN17_SACKO|nr:PREDICTED: malignant T-cell-amplified sequence 1-like [Saccoglossus kowalevskii]
MFKKFDEKEHVSGMTPLKSSVQKAMKNKIIQMYPNIEPYITQIMPKKEGLKVVKCHDHIELFAVGNELIFFRQRESPYYPCLRLLHKYPMILPKQRVDRGAIRFILSGANIMCPGLTSPGATLIPAEQDSVVAIMAEGKEHALAIGVMKMSSTDIQTINKGIGVENVHYLNDGLWHVKL